MYTWPQPLWHNDHVTSTFVARAAQPLWQKECRHAQAGSTFMTTYNTITGERPRKLPLLPGFYE